MANRHGRTTSSASSISAITLANLPPDPAQEVEKILRNTVCLRQNVIDLEHIVESVKSDRSQAVHNSLNTWRAFQDKFTLTDEQDLICKAVEKMNDLEQTVWEGLETDFKIIEMLLHKSCLTLARHVEEIRETAMADNLPPVETLRGRTRERG